MIASLRGLVSAVAPDCVVIDVAGVGLLVYCTPSTIATLHVGESAQLSTSLVVREDSLTLYGFVDDDERGLFELLQTASGVGPRLAQAVLAVHSPYIVRHAVASGDTATLTQVPGIGKKGAERLILELRDRIGSTAAISSADNGASFSVSGERWRDQLQEALIGLGWGPKQAEDAVLAVAPQARDGADVQTLLRSALQLLGRR